MSADHPLATKDRSCLQVSAEWEENNLVPPELRYSHPRSTLSSLSWFRPNDSPSIWISGGSIVVRSTLR